MAGIRKPLLWVATAITFVVVLIELGATEMLPAPVSAAAVPGLLSKSSYPSGDPAGWGIPYLAMIDGLLCYALLMMALSVTVSAAVQTRFEKIATLIGSLLYVLAGLAWLLTAMAMLLLMVGTVLAPSGIAIYMGKWGAFPIGSAAGTLGAVMTLKIGAVIVLFLAHPYFAKNIPLVVLLLLSFIGTALISFLHGFVPFPFVSIADVLAALIVGILGWIWGIILLLSGLLQVIKLIVRTATATAEAAT